MKKLLALAIAVALATPIAGLAQPPGGAILPSAERVALGMELQSDAPPSQRSMGRTWTGVGMIVAGAAMATTMRRRVTCSRGVCVSETEWYKPTRYPGMGLAVAGVLLATLWSDVPTSPHIDLAVSPDGIRVGGTFGF